jgi:AcrR family transcriptional regulator
MTSAPRATRPPGSGRRGRRPGDSADRKDAILEAARTSFADHGYTRTTIRGVAAAAGVDPALVHHYFGSKDDLFLAALELPVDPRVVLAPALAGGLDGAGERFLRVFLSVWDDPALRPRLVAVARGMLDPGGSDLLRTGFLKTVLEPVGRALGVDRPEHRMPLVASQVVGLILMRYLIEMEPVASMPAEQVVATYAPTIQRYLADDLP